jgi:hypothetical protein
MKKIETKAFKKLSADEITHAPVPDENGVESKPIKGKRKKKKLPQLGRKVRDVSINDLV